MSSDDLFLKCLQSSYQAYFETEPAGLDKRQLMETLISKMRIQLFDKKMDFEIKQNLVSTMYEIKKFLSAV